MTQSVKPWLEAAGRFPVEHIPCPFFSQPVALDAPRTGVLHTTEGGWDGSMSVFKQHFAPHFMVGMDQAHGKVRIAQLVQVGTIGAALVAHNDHAIVQVEMIGFSKESPWLPDPDTFEALASLMAVCNREYGIPLTHPWADGDFGHAGDNPHRGIGRWGVIGGWYGHGDVPSPDTHWDPGALQWSMIFARAGSMTDIIGAPAWTPPTPPDRHNGGASTPSPYQRPGPATPAVIAAMLWSPSQIKWIQAKVGSTTDGYWGPKTEGAVRVFQAGAKLYSDGIIGEKTLAAMDAAS